MCWNTETIILIFSISHPICVFYQPSSFVPSHGLWSLLGRGVDQCPSKILLPSGKKDQICLRQLSPVTHLINIFLHCDKKKRNSRKQRTKERWPLAFTRVVGFAATKLHKSTKYSFLAFMKTAFGRQCNNCVCYAYEYKPNTNEQYVYVYTEACEILYHRGLNQSLFP